MAHVSEEQIRQTLSSIAVPTRDGNVVSLGMISGIVIKDGNVGFSIEIDPAEKDELESMRQTCEDAVRGLDGVVSATAVLTAESTPAANAHHARQRGAVNIRVEQTDTLAVRR